VINFITRAQVLPPRWSTTKCAVTVERLTGEAMVAASSSEYAMAYLYSIALAREVDPASNFDLTDRQSTVAFKLARAWRRAAGHPLAQPGGEAEGHDAEMAAHATDDEEEDGADKEPGPLAWEQQDEELEEDLLQVLSRHQAGSLQLSAKELLDSLPAHEGIKKRAEVNNHRQDAGAKLDRLLKGSQQKVLGLQKVYCCLHGSLHSEDKILGQKFFGLLLQFEEWLLAQRKEQSIPGSISTAEAVLFTAEDLKHRSEKDRINAAGIFSDVRSKSPESFFPGDPRRGVSCLCPSTGYKGIKYKGGKNQRPRWSPGGYGFGYGHKGAASGAKGAGRGRGWPSQRPKGGKGPKAYCAGTSGGAGPTEACPPGATGGAGPTAACPPHIPKPDPPRLAGPGACGSGIPQASEHHRDANPSPPRP
jgi:hypothetical protein